METWWIVITILVCMCSRAQLNPNWDISCEYGKMTVFLHELAANHTSISRLVSIGKTEQDREIWTMIVSDSPHIRPLLKPQVKFVGNVNGMSGPACYVLLRLTKQLLEEYQSEASMERKLMESMEIHIIPNLNPDGYAKAVPGSCLGQEGRLNANNVKLNGNFPDLFHEDQAKVPLQKETEALMRWMDSNKFIISVSVISGAKVVVYPWDGIIVDESMTGPDGEPHFTPDDDIFKHLSLIYTQKTGTPREGWICPALQRTFPYGIVNGAEWMPQPGTMMDYNYVQGTFEIMVGISCCRNENDPSVLGNLWWKNREGLLHVIHEVDSGIRGQVLDSETYEAIGGASLSQVKHDYNMENEVFSMIWFSSDYGEFWRPWRPGVYKLRVAKEGYREKEVKVQVKLHQPTFLRIEMEKVEPTIRQTSPPQHATTARRQEEETESIKKMTTSHDEFHYKATAPLDSGGAVTEATNENSQPDIRSLKHYSSLTQLDHSFINLFRGVQLRNAATKSHSHLLFSLFITSLVLVVQDVVCSAGR